MNNLQVKPVEVIYTEAVVKRVGMEMWDGITIRAEDDGGGPFAILSGGKNAEELRIDLDELEQVLVTARNMVAQLEER